MRVRWKVRIAEGAEAAAIDAEVNDIVWELLQ